MDKEYFLMFFSAIFLLPLICSADVIIPTRGENILGVVLPFIIDFIANAIILTLCYVVIKEGSLIRSWKFLFYIAIITIGGFLIDIIGGVFFSGYLRNQLWGAGSIYDSVNLFSEFLIFVLLYFFNNWVSKRFMKLTSGKAVFVGLAISILTNPFLVAPLLVAPYTKLYKFFDTTLHLRGQYHRVFPNLP